MKNNPLALHNIAISLDLINMGFIPAMSELERTEFIVTDSRSGMAIKSDNVDFYNSDKPKYNSSKVYFLSFYDDEDNNAYLYYKTISGTQEEPSDIFSDKLWENLNAKYSLTRIPVPEGGMNIFKIAELSCS